MIHQFAKFQISLSNMNKAKKKILIPMSQPGQPGAAVKYSQKKCAHLNTAAKCAEEGVAFEPVVFTTLGGIEPRGAAILHRIAECVAAAEGAQLDQIKSDMLQRLTICVARTSAQTIRRRMCYKGSVVGKIVATLATATTLLEEVEL